MTRRSARWKKKKKEQSEQSQPKQQNELPQSQPKPKKKVEKKPIGLIDKDTRIKINELLKKFEKSADKEHTFDSNLTKLERAAVHLLCRKMGMKSKSSGHGVQRQVSVFKTGTKAKEKRKAKTVTKAKMPKEDLTCFIFSENAKEVLQNLFTQYPPDDCEMDEKIISEPGGNIDVIRRERDTIFARPSMSKYEIKSKVESLARRVEKAPKLKQITKERAKLPIANFKEVITTTIDSHQVVLISGETGCGKTTQVPQYILDYVWGKDETCKIVCTQPRRISAISVAERISSERGETVGDSVGYKIRLESKGGKNSSILFCTNGVLLRVLVTHGSKRLGRKASSKIDNDFGMTHIIVDEIHERDKFSDIMLAIMRDMLPLHPSLRLVLMSATIDAERFSQYFGGCPIIRVPGFTYPVKTFYLEDVLFILKSSGNNHPDCTAKDSEMIEEYRTVTDEAINMAWSNDELGPLLDLVSSGGANLFNYQHSLTGVTPLMVFAAKGRVGDLCMLLSFGADCHIRDNDGATALEWAKRENQGEAAEILKKQMETDIMNSEEEKPLLDKYLATTDSGLIDVVLVEQLLRKICTDSTDGAILVFLPGWDDIKRTKEKLEANSLFKDSSKFHIFTLHSKVPAKEQKEVFKKLPPGCRKIILSTNIAETAITIDDVVYVLDCGRMKEKSYDPYNNVSTLQSSWISKASAKQREGRAGRCQPGTCYHLYSKQRAASFSDFQVPEIKRMPIEELCLQVKLLEPDCKIEDFLRKLLDPPISESMRNAIIVLQDIGALSPDEELTELGEKLGSLPLHPLTSKMLFFAILMNCLDPALTLACATDYKDPFTLPMSPTDKKLASSAKLELASLYGGRSDQLAIVAAFECWKNAKERGQEAQFCSKFFVSSGTMNMLFGMRKQLERELIRKGFIPESASCCSINAHDPGIVDAVLVAGLYPMVGRLLLPQNGKRSVIKIATGEKVRLNSNSINSNLCSEESDDQPLVIFDEVIRGDGGLQVRNCSVIYPLPLLLLATEIAVAPTKGDEKVEHCEPEDDNNSDECEMETHSNLSIKGGNSMSSPDNRVKVVVDRWLSFESTALDVAQICCLRDRLSAATLFKAMNPRATPPEHLKASIHAIIHVLSYDGLSMIPSTRNCDDQPTEISQSNSNHGRKNGSQSSRYFLRSLASRESGSIDQSNAFAYDGMVDSDDQTIFRVQELLPSLNSALHVEDTSSLSMGTINLNDVQQPPPSNLNDHHDVQQPPPSNSNDHHDVQEPPSNSNGHHDIQQPPPSNTYDHHDIQQPPPSLITNPPCLGCEFQSLVPVGPDSTPGTISRKRKRRLKNKNKSRNSGIN